MKSRVDLFVAWRVLTGLLFVWSGYSKLMAPPEDFLLVIHTYQVLPATQAMWVAHVLPWAEYVAGAFLIFGLWTRLSTGVLWLTNSALVAALTQALLRKLPLEDCGCFGQAIKVPPPVMLALDVCLWLVFLGLFVGWRRTRRAGLDERLDG